MLGSQALGESVHQTKPSGANLTIPSVRFAPLGPLLDEASGPRHAGILSKSAQTDGPLIQHPRSRGDAGPAGIRPLRHLGLLASRGAPPGPVRSIACEPGQPPVLFVVVDTEEEFDWDAPFSRANTSVTHVRDIGRFQDICDRAGVRPIYAIDYPVATDPESVEVFSRFHRERRAEIGCHLHTWVNPPFTEAVSAMNSYQANLPDALQLEKLSILTARIEENLGVRPRIHKAGRYGFGPGTLPILRELGYEIDASFSPGFDFRADGGPNYARASSRPGWLDEAGTVLELPATGGLLGALGRWGPGLLPAISGSGGQHFRAPGIFSLLRLLERIRLTPEGFTLAEMIRLTHTLRRNGVSVFTLTLHSPSMKPGCTPYVRDRGELGEFLKRFADYLTFFRAELGGVFMDPFEFRTRSLGQSGAR